jgi:ribose transport system ATP-binding protein
MVGRELSGDYYRSDYDPSTLNEVALELKDATADGINDLNITLHKGEILGIGGLSHCGMHKLGKVLFGSIKLNKGSYLVHGNKIKDEAAAMKEGIGYVSKDRDTESLNLNASILDNISIAGMDKFAIKNFLLLRKNENAYVDKEVKDLSIKCFDKFQDVSHLSGGNKQKVVFGKWVGRESEILILDCPTRGVDIGVKQFMYQLMYSLKKEGKSIVLISEEMAELIGMSDRLLIMKDGRITKEFERSADLTDSKVIDYMI